MTCYPSRRLALLHTRRFDLPDARNSEGKVVLILWMQWNGEACVF